MAEWKTTTPAGLVAALRIGGDVYGKSGVLPRSLILHKTHLIRDLRALPDNHLLTWTIRGNPDETGRHAKDRRSVVIWLGK